MNVYGQARIFAHQRARGAGVIEMDVREEDRVEIADGNSLRGKARAQCRQRGLRAGVYHGKCGGAAQQTSSDGLRPAEEIYVNRDCVRSEIFHGQTAIIPREEANWCGWSESNRQWGKSPADFKPAAYANFATAAPRHAASTAYHALEARSELLLERFANSGLHPATGLTALPGEIEDL